MPYIGAGIQRFNTADGLTVNGNAEVTGTTALTGNATAAGTLDVTGAVTADAGVSVDNITIDGTEIDLSSGNLTLDVAGDINLDADGGDVNFKDGGTSIGYLSNSSGTLLLGVNTSDSDFKVQGNDGGSTINALTLDMSEAGAATFNAGATFADGCTITTADNTTQLTLKSTDDDASEGPRLDLRRDSASPADNDAIGTIRFLADDDSGSNLVYAEIQTHARDVSAGATDSEMQFLIRRGGTTREAIQLNENSVVFNDAGDNVDFRIESDGNANMFIVDGGNNSVMVGDNTGASYSDGGLFVRHAGGANNSPLCVVNGTTSGTRRMIDFFVGTGTSRVGSIQSNDSVTAYNTSSDYRLKENVTDMTGAIDRVKALAPKRFNFIISPDTIVDGFLAHEVSSIVPEAISGEKDEVATWGKEEKLPDGVKVGDNKLDDDGNTIPIMQGIDHSKLVPLLTAALKEAVAKIESLETRVTTLEGE